MAFYCNQSTFSLLKFRREFFSVGWWIPVVSLSFGLIRWNRSSTTFMSCITYPLSQSNIQFTIYNFRNLFCIMSKLYFWLPVRKGRTPPNALVTMKGTKSNKWNFFVASKYRPCDNKSRIVNMSNRMLIE